jgi:hypothetical protein
MTKDFIAPSTPSSQRKSFFLFLQTLAPFAPSRETWFSLLQLRISNTFG